MSQRADELDTPLYCDCGSLAIVECKICGAPTCGCSCGHHPCYELEEPYRRERTRCRKEMLNNG